MQRLCSGRHNTSHIWYFWLCYTFSTACNEFAGYSKNFLSTFNFALNNRFTYRDRQLSGTAWFTGLLSFYLVCSLGAVANVGIGSLVYDRLPEWWVAGIAGAIVGSVWNYVASGWLTWTRR